MKKSFNNLRIGILGGGQLGRMLLQKAADFSLNIKILDPDPAAPCSYLAEEFFTGSFQDYDTVYSFGKNCDLLTIEIEHVNTEALAKLESEGVTVYPQPSIIKLIQDKGEQKLFFKKHNIPTAGFELITSKKDLGKIKTGLPVIQKLRKGGYDGKGVYRIASESDFPSAFDQPSIIEKLIPFQKEIAVIVARSESGECRSFPPVEMEFSPEANLVEFLFSPAAVDDAIASESRALAIHIANSLEIVGLLAVEMFLTDQNEILVNEIAPRPHNSGHHTIEGNKTSQYEQHLRAILGLPLGSTDTILPSGMINLLGEKNFNGNAKYLNIEKALAIEGTYVHLYGKRLTKPFRKMGHITVTASSVEEVKEKATTIKDLVKVVSE